MSKDRPPLDRSRKEKKSETLEVRIPYDTKQAFLTACREDGTTASEVVRDSVQTYLDERERPPQPEERSIVMRFPQPVRRYGWRALAGGAAAVGFVSLAVLPSAASPDFLSAFKKLDLNGDGVLSADEFAGPKEAKGGDSNVVIETRSHQVIKNGKDAPPPPTAPSAGSEVKQDAFSFWLPDGLVKDGGEQQHEYKFISQREVRSTAGDNSSSPPQPPITISMDDIRKKEFESFDTDHDGKVSLAEYQARQRAMLTRGFEMLDANHDKSLSQAEYAKIVSPPMIKLNPDDPDTPDAREITISGGPKISADALKAAFTKLDANKDGKLSLQEYLPPA